MLKKILGFGLGIMLLEGFVGIVGIAGYIETHYTMECEVVEIDGNITTLEDSTGNFWEVENEDLELNQTYKVTFFGGSTVNRLDDEIVKIRVDK